MHAKNPDLYQVVEFRKMAAYGLILLAQRVFKYGEAHFQLLLVDLKGHMGGLTCRHQQHPVPVQLFRRFRSALNTISCSARKL